MDRESRRYATERAMKALTCGLAQETNGGSNLPASARQVLALSHTKFHIRPRSNMHDLAHGIRFDFSFASWHACRGMRMHAVVRGRGSWWDFERHARTRGKEKGWERDLVQDVVENEVPCSWACLARDAGLASVGLCCAGQEGQRGLIREAVLGHVQGE